jgi:hypothetical protein
MALVVFICLAWCSCFLFIETKKLPLSANFLLYMALSIIDINKLTIISFKFKLFQTSEKIPLFLSLILYREFIFTITLLTFANIYLAANNRSIKIGITLCTVAFILLIAQSLRWFGIVKDIKWNSLYELITIVCLMAISLWFGQLFTKMARKERLAP